MHFGSLELPLERLGRHLDVILGVLGCCGRPFWGSMVLIEFSWVSREFGRVSRDFGGASRDIGGGSRDSGAVSRDVGKVSRDFGGVSRDFGGDGAPEPFPDAIQIILIVLIVS